MNRLFTRIFLWFWLGSTGLLLVVAASTWIARPDIISSWRAIRQRAMLQDGSRAVAAYERGGRAAADEALEAIAGELRFRVWLYAADGRAIGSAAAPAGDIRELVARALEGDEVERASGEGAFLLARRIEGTNGARYVFLWESPFRLRAPLPAGGALFSFRLAALVLTGGVVCLWLTWQITRPIRTLREAARRFSEGDLTVRVSGQRELRRGDELSDLARELDHMAARIQELVDSRQRLLADISHELRSPLARLSLALDLARRRLGTDDLPEHDRIAREISRLDALIEQLLTLSRLQMSTPDFAAEPVDLRELVRQVVQDARFEAEASQRTVRLARDCPAVLAGSPALLRSALENVLRNAIRHTAPASEVTVTMTASRDGEPREHARGDEVTITIRDRGPGVPAEALDRLFDPFYRVEAGRERTSGGVGLGLAIAREAMRRHGGRAHARNHPDGGLIVLLELPHRPAPTNPDKSSP